MKRLISSRVLWGNGKRHPIVPLLIAALCAAAALVPGQFALGASANWIGNTDGNWATGANWAGGAAPGGTAGSFSTDVATFNADATYKNILVDAGRTIGTFSFDTNAASYTFTAADSIFLTRYDSSSDLSLYMRYWLQGSNKTMTFNAPLVLNHMSGQGGGTFNFCNFSSNPTNVLQINGSITPANVSSGTVSLYLKGLNTGENTISGVISDDPGGMRTRLLKTGAGTWTLSGLNTYTGETRVVGGTLRLDFRGKNTGTNNILYHGVTLDTNMGALVLGTDLEIVGDATRSHTQQVPRVDLMSGSQVSIQPGAGGSLTVYSQTGWPWRRNMNGGYGGTINFKIGDGGVFKIQTSYTGEPTNPNAKAVGLVNDLLCVTYRVSDSPMNYPLLPLALATYNGNDWASLGPASGTYDDRDVIALPAGSYTNDVYTGAAVHTNVTEANPAPAAVSSATIAFRQNQNYNLTLPTGTTSTVGMGGILVGSAVGADKTVVISGGPLASTAPAFKSTQTDTELVFHQNSAGTVKLLSDVVLQGGGPAHFTKTGDGTLIFVGTKSYTGNTNVSRGTLQLGDGANLGSVSGAIRVNAGGTLVFDNDVEQTFSKDIIGSESPYDIAATKVVKRGSGKLILTGANPSKVPQWTLEEGIVSFSGSTGNQLRTGPSSNTLSPDLVMDGGTLQYTGSSAITMTRFWGIGPNGGTFDAAGTGLLTLNGNTHTGAGPTGDAGDRTVTLTGTGNGNLGFGVPDPFNGGKTSVVKTGTGTWSMTYGSGGSYTNVATATGNLVVEQGTLKLAGGTYRTPMPFGTVDVKQGATLDIALTTTSYGGTSYGTPLFVLRAGQTLKGNGTVTSSGNTALTLVGAAGLSYVAPGDSVGTLTTGSEYWFGATSPTAAGHLVWEVNSVSALGGDQGAGNGADLLDINGTLNLTNVTASKKFYIDLVGLNGDAEGAVANWKATNNYSWTIVTTDGDLSAEDLTNRIALDLSGFTSHNSISGSISDGYFSVATSGNNIVLNYTAAAGAVPEPGTIAMLLMGCLGLALFAWKRR